MSVTREEAVEALGQVRRADRRMHELKLYSHAAPHFMIWGAVWLIAYSVTDLAPSWTNWAWVACLIVGGIASFVAGMTAHRRRPEQGQTAEQAASAYGSRFAALGVVFFLFFLCLFVINPATSSRQGSTLMAIAFPFLYMGAGVFAGWRLFAIGAVAAALIMSGYFLVQEHFYLYMGAVAGGSLILAGLWLRKA